jgi:drug/metabolite transporter (DMT)-like permease
MAQPRVSLSDAEVAERLRGIGLICAAVLAFTFIDVPAKYAGNFVPTIEVAWARYTGALIFAVAALRPWRHAADYRTGRPLMQSLRGLFLLLSTAFNFAAIHYLPLAQTVSIMFAAPLLVTALAGPLLDEWAGPRRWAAVIVGFVGVLIVVQPQPSTFQPATLLSLTAALFVAGYYLTTRTLSISESPAGLLIYGTAVGVVLLTPAMPFVAVPPPTLMVTLALVLSGIAGGIGHWFLILASRHAPAPVLAPFTYTQIVWMIAAGYAFFGDTPTASNLVGAAIVIACGLYILYRERIHRDD